ncbi:MAG: DUF3592 domain-containing protein [Deltaproteobacteria bacterium]|nr:DUF3592 domain-containing protein [Deltaproteobacteria bacterium]
MASRNADMIVGISASVVFVVIGCVLCYFGIYLYNKNNALRATGIVTKGAVLRLETHRTSSTGNEKIIVPVIGFTTKAGKTITFNGSMNNKSLLTKSYKPGENVEVVYDPHDPSNAKVNAFAEFWFAPLLLLFIGAAFIFFPPFTIWKYWKETIKSCKKV